MSYQIGDLLKLTCEDGDAFCVITDIREKSDNYRVSWIIEKGNVKNTPAYTLWYNQILKEAFTRL